MEEFADCLKAELSSIDSPHRVFVDISQPCLEQRTWPEILPEIKAFVEQQLILLNKGEVDPISWTGGRLN
jgi:hypothetical protein